MKLSELQFHLKRSEQPVLVEFWAPWCAPCRMMAPALEQLAGKYKGQVTLHKFNADEHPDLLRALNVRAIPTLLVFQDGAETRRLVGAQSPGTLGGLFERLAAGEDTSPQPLPSPGMDSVARMLRLAAGALLMLLGVWLSLWYVVLAGALVTFWAVHDRCPIWQAIAPRLKRLLPGQE
jgi:thioredoxin